MNPQPADRRVKQLAAIHVAAKQLGMDRDTYRAMIERVSAQAGGRVARTSSADLDDAQRAAVLDELRRLGGEAPRVRSRRGPAKPGAYPGRPHNAKQMPLMITKIEAQLADMGMTWAYADAIAKRMFSIDRVAWCRSENQLRAIIAALHVEQEKQTLDAGITALVADLRMPEAEFARLTAPLPPNWRRNRYHLRRVCEHLAALRIKQTQLENARAP